MEEHLQIEKGVEARDLHIDEAHTALDIFRFAAFFSQELIFDQKCWNTLFFDQDLFD